MGYLSEANELQPGLVPSHCYLPATQKVTVPKYRFLQVRNPYLKYCSPNIEVYTTAPLTTASSIGPKKGNLARNKPKSSCYAQLTLLCVVDL